MWSCRNRILGNLCCFAARIKGRLDCSVRNGTLYSGMKTEIGVAASDEQVHDGGGQMTRWEL